MHTDDHILESFIAADRPLPAIAAHLGMTLIALVKWVDRNADLLTAARRALETHIAVLSLNAEARALIDLTNVSSSTQNEERKRKGASQLLRHTAKRLLTNPTREREAPCASEALDALGEPPPSPRAVADGENVPSTEGAWGMAGDASEPRTTAAPLPNLVASGVQRVPTRTTSSPPNPECPMPKAPSLSDHDIDLMMATLARHFNIDLAADDAASIPANTAPCAGAA